MIGRRLPLKTKLILALLGPLLALGVLGAVQVRQLRADVQLADAQRAQVDDNVAVVEVLSAIRSERDAQLTIAGNSDGLDAGQGTSGADSFLARVRENTDERFAEVLADPDLSESTRTLVTQTESALAVARTTIGDEVSSVRADLVEEMTDPAFEMTLDSTMGGLLTFDVLIANTIELLEVDPSTLVDPETALDLTSLDVVTQFDEAVRQEALTYLQLSLFPIEDQPESLVQQAHILGGQVEALERTVLLVSSDSYQSSLGELLGSREYQDFRDLRADVLDADAGEVVVSQSTVLSFLLDLTTQLNGVNDQIIDGARLNADDAKSNAQRNLVIGGALTALLALAVAIIAYSSYRSIRRPLLKLTERSREIADVELPTVVTLLRREGHEAEVPGIVPIESESSDEIGDLVNAFNDMHRTAIELASEQAASRRTVADMFVNLGRRNQKLLNRILTYLESLEEDERDPEMLEKLFKVDHLATRMRRNAESLLVLAGARASRVFSDPVSVADVARSALAEVEGYERVHLDIRGEAEIGGEAVADVAHLLAELMENALSFSPPTTPVVVIATNTPDGYYMAVADQGIGMSKTELANANAQISEALTLEETSSKFLGHHVVGRLAARHGIEVELIDGLVTGVTARILVPSALLNVVETGEDNTASLEAVTESSLSAGAIPALPASTEHAQTELEPEQIEVGTSRSDLAEREFSKSDLSIAEWGRVDAVTSAPEAGRAVVEEPVVPSVRRDQPVVESSPEADRPEWMPTSRRKPSDGVPSDTPVSNAPVLGDSSPDEQAIEASVLEPQAPLASSPKQAPEGRAVLDPRLLPRRAVDASENEAVKESRKESSLSFGAQVASAEESSARVATRRATDTPNGDSRDVASGDAATEGEGSAPLGLARRTPGATRSTEDATPKLTPRSEEEEIPADPEEVREAGRAFASSLVGFQQGVTRASDQIGYDPAGDAASSTGEHNERN